MKSVAMLALLLFTAAVSFGQFVPSAGSSGWGPSWVGGGPPGGNPRPTKFDAAETRCAFADDESRLGMEVKFWCDGEVAKGHEYQLLYQFRVQTKKGEFGPLLGTTAQPDGTTFFVVSATADDKWNGLEGAADVTRKDLSGMTNLPKGKTATLRIEPQLLDQTTGKYVTDAKTRAIIVKADVGENGHVQSVLSLASWIIQNAQYEPDAVLATMADLDAFDEEGNRMGDAFGKVLGNKEIPAATRLRLIHAVSKKWVHMKDPSLWGAINDLANGNDAGLKAAARELLNVGSAQPSSPAPHSSPAPLPPSSHAPIAPNSLVPAGRIETGQLFITTIDGATSAKDVLAAAAVRMAGSFDAKPAFQGAYGDDKDKFITAAFRAKQKGVEIRGVVIASIGPKGGSAAVAFDHADAALATLPRLLATLPRGPVDWHDASTADGSIQLRLPQGWLINGAQGMCDIGGTEGQFMSLGIHLTINTPEVEQAFANQRMQIGLPPQASGAFVAPITDPATAVRNVFPQMYKSLAASGLGEIRFGQVVESAKAPLPPGLGGDAALVHYTIEATINRTRIISHVIANVICSPMPNGQWMLYYSQVGAPEATFARDLPMLLEAWKGYTVSNAEIMRRMDDAMQSMRETNKLITESAANARHVSDRCNADFDEMIHGYRTVEDSETGKWSEVDLGWSQKIVEKLNEHAGYARFREIPLRDQIFSP
jgi:hypothetical protein